MEAAIESTVQKRRYDFPCVVSLSIDASCVRLFQFLFSSSLEIKFDDATTNQIMKSIEYGQRNKAVIIHVIIKHSFTNYYFAARCYDDGD